MADEEKRRGRKGGRGSASSGGPLYGLGWIGALVWFWQQAEGFGEHVVGFLKAAVWPAFLVYEAFQSFQG